VLKRAFIPVAFIGLLFPAAAGAQVLGWRTIDKGDRGGDVFVLQRVLGMNGYHPGPVDGVFGRRTKHEVKRFQRRRHLTVDGRVGPVTTHALSFSWPVKAASYYGPGLWGNRTACGQTLRKGTHGVAHRSFPCGTRVAVYANQRISVFRVIDRGPYRDGVAIDLTRASARRLHVSTTQDVRFSR
jgi:rare lipoprotein A (peptidoglycan hydrolase)